MTVARVSLLTSLISLAGALLSFVLLNGAVGTFWLAFSLVWLVISIVQVRKGRVVEPAPLRRLSRRFSRLLLWS